MSDYMRLKKIMDARPALFKDLDNRTGEGKFRVWLRENMEIYDAFTQYARDYRSIEHRDIYSANAIWQRIRWDTMMGGSGKDDKEWKLNAIYTSFFARLVMAAEPDLEGMFKLRGSKSRG
jgi:hypothetical protein